jgi:folylpolyglutamate synthase/dihydropteroate synthase
VPNDIINQWLQHVSHPGRLEYILPNLLIDGAHNQQWLESLKTYIDSIKQNYSQIIYCFSIKRWKENKIQEYIIERFWKENEYIIVDHDHPLLAQKKDIITQFNIATYTIHTPYEIRKLAQDNKSILYIVFWSLYMIGWFYNKKQ